MLGRPGELEIVEEQAEITYRESGSCTNSRMVNRNKIEAAFLDGLREVLEDQDYFKVYLKTYNDERTRLARGAVRDRANLERRSREINRELDRLVDSIVQGMPADVIAPKARALEAEKVSIAEQLAAADDKRKLVSIHRPRLRTI